jgi:hypothetical protein
LTRVTFEPVISWKCLLNTSTHLRAGSLTPRPKVVEPPNTITVTLGGMGLRVAAASAGAGAGAGAWMTTGAQARPGRRGAIG